MYLTAKTDGFKIRHNLLKYDPMIFASVNKRISMKPIPFSSELNDLSVPVEILFFFFVEIRQSDHAGYRNRESNAVGFAFKACL